MKKLADYALRIGSDEYVPIVIGGMGVDISTAEMANEACRLGGIGHVSDAMVTQVCDKLYGTHYCADKAKLYSDTRGSFDKSAVKFDLDILREAQMRYIGDVMSKKSGSGGIFVNVMEKLTMAGSKETLNVRLNAAVDAGIDGITLSAGLHQFSMGMIVNNPNARRVKIGIVVSSARALAVFVRSASRSGRLPDYVVLEGPLAGGHLGFGDDWADYNLCSLLQELVTYMQEKDLHMPIIAAGGVFSGHDAVKLIEMGAKGVQVATRFTITKESGLSEEAKQAYCRSQEADVVVSHISPTGYPIRHLTVSPCLNSNVMPNCEAFGYVLNDKGTCQYLEAYKTAMLNTLDVSKVSPIRDKICLCHHFAKHSCYTCGHNVFRLKETLPEPVDGVYKLPTTEEVFLDYKENEGIATL